MFILNQLGENLSELLYLAIYSFLSDKDSNLIQCPVNRYLSEDVLFALLIITLCLYLLI